MIVVDVRVGKKIQSFPGHDLPKWINNNTYYKPIWKLYKSIIGFLSCQSDHCNNNYYNVELSFPNEKLLKSLSVSLVVPEWLMKQSHHRNCDFPMWRPLKAITGFL